MATVQTPGGPAVERRRGNGGKCAGGCCGCGALVGLLTLLGVIFGGHAMLERMLVEQLESNVGPAAEWNADFATLAPVKWMLGRPADLTITGRDVMVESQYSLADLTVEVEGLAIDAAATKVKSVDRASFDLGLTGETLTQIAQQQMGPSAEQVTIALENNKLMIRMALPVGPKSAKITVAATPQVLPPAKVKLVVDDLTIDSAGLPAELLPVAEQLKPRLRNELAKALVFDLGEQAQGMTLRSVAVDGTLLRATGEMPTATLTAP